jgi:hypothetical protein
MCVWFSNVIIFNSGHRKYFFTGFSSPSLFLDCHYENHSIVAWIREVFYTRVEHRWHQSNIKDIYRLLGFYTPSDMACHHWEKLLIFNNRMYLLPWTNSGSHWNNYTLRRSCTVLNESTLSFLICNSSMNVDEMDTNGIFYFYTPSNP